MNKTTLSWGIITLTLAITATGSVPSQSKILKNATATLPLKEGLQEAALLSGEPNVFPFEIAGSRFLLNGEDVFLNIIGYQPLEPGQGLGGEIHERRVRDDLRRWRTYKGGSDPIVLRVYPGPTPEEPNQPRVPKCFYDGVRDLGFWIIRDIYFDPNYCDPNVAIKRGQDAIDAVIAEVNDANGLDRILAWEIGNEFEPNEALCLDEGTIKDFVENMCAHIKTRIAELDTNNVSDWVTWASWVPNDPLRTGGNPIEPNCLDFISYNVYSYEPARIRDHQSGPTTGTPYQGYLAALKAEHPNEPLVIIETGLADSVLPEPDSDHERIRPWYPAYRKGGMSEEQVAEGLADRYWDARLLQDANDPNIVIVGLAIFEWNDEWHKLSDPNNQADYPEEHFGLGRFVFDANRGRYQLRYKLQQETIRDLYTLNFDNDVNIIESLVVDDNSISVDANTWVRVVLSDSAAKPVRFRWETSRGYIIGDPNNEKDANSVKFYAGGRWLGPAKITAVAIDANGNADSASITIDVNTIEEPNIEILTFGVGVDMNDPNVKASGRVYNVNLDENKLIVYIETNQLYAQPYNDMKSIWIGSDGYWWTKITNSKDVPSEFYCWLVPEEYEPNDYEPNGWSPSSAIAEANTVAMNPNDYNDVDNDLLLDRWERKYFNNINKYDRYDDPDGDMGNNLEEFLRGLDPNDANDDDKDGLRDNWEYHFFGDKNFFDANDDPDGDGLKNWQEQEPNLGMGPDPNLGTHPVRASQDKDQDGLPDLWEVRWFGNCDANEHDNPDKDCFNNLDEYELGLDPTSRMADLDLNCNIDLIDYSLFTLHWGEIDCNELNNWCGWADLDESGEVNWVDLYLLTENWLRRLY